ncbi:MAG: phosphoglucosamine mutase [Bryobacteraceae bacterium]
MSRQLFGTDGIRGVAGEYPLDPQTVHAVGLALGNWCVNHPHAGADAGVVIGMDTRESGEWIAGQLAGGLAAAGVSARLAGVITTPGVAYLTHDDGFAAGVMISASHNPFQDNGIKIFGPTGYKLPDAEELAIEKDILSLRGTPVSTLALTPEPELDEQYIEHLASAFRGSLEGRTVVLDCGNGAAFRLAPDLLRRLGARVVAIGCDPTGRNINLECGATHVESLRRRVVEENADAGFAFDGDADRCIAVASSGKVVDGDAVLLMAGVYLKSRGELTGDVVVATVMSNLGLQKALAAAGIELVRTAVGDKYVLEEMVRRGAAVGGEQSGHVIFLSQATTGDGLLTCLRVLEVMAATGSSLEDLTGALEIYPQTLVNVRVKERRPLAELVAVNAAIQQAEAALGADGRVLVRFSGTEPLARVMVEGPTIESVSNHANQIAGVIRSELGG